MILTAILAMDLTGENMSSITKQKKCCEVVEQFCEKFGITKTELRNECNKYVFYSPILGIAMAVLGYPLNEDSLEYLKTIGGTLYHENERISFKQLLEMLPDEDDGENINKYIFDKTIEYGIYLIPNNDMNKKLKIYLRKNFNLKMDKINEFISQEKILMRIGDKLEMETEKLKIEELGGKIIIEEIK